MDKKNQNRDRPVIPSKIYPEFGGLAEGEIKIRLQILDNLLNIELDTEFLKESLTPKEQKTAKYQTDKRVDLTATKNDFIVIAHRGWSGSYPENTIIGMREAIKLGCHMIEFDVAITKDRKLIIIHDDTLSRTTNGIGRVNKWNFDDLRELDAGSWFHPGYAGARLPTLDEILSVARASSIEVNIEIKKECWEEKLQKDGVEQQIIESVFRHDICDRVIISSFHWPFIERIYKLNHKIRTALLYFEDLGKLHPARLKARYGCNAFNPHGLVLTQKFVDQAHKAGIKIYVFTVNTYQDMEKYIDMNVDGVFTNHPNRLFKFIEKHNERMAELKTREEHENVDDLTNAIRRMEIEELEKARKRSRRRAKRQILKARKEAMRDGTV